MKNITIKCLLTVLFVSEALATEDPEAILGNNALVRPRCTTPVKLFVEMT